MLDIEIGLFFAVIAIGVIGYFIGKSRGYEDGYGHGYIAGGNKVVGQWAQSQGYTRLDPDEAINRSVRKHLGH